LVGDEDCMNAKPSRRVHQGSDTVLGLDTSVRGAVAYRPIGQMPKRHDPRQRLVDTALELFASRSYYHTSIAEILRESGCTRGTLYYYFSSKEELGYAAIDEALRRLVEQGAASHFHSNEHPIDRLLRVIDSLPSFASQGRERASASEIAIQMASAHEGFRKRLGARLEAMSEQVDAMVRSGMADGQIADSVDPDQLSHMVATLCAGIQLGALLWEREVIREDARRWLKDYLNSLRR
jgi:TetR/AcrR family transcriptional repressor of nem operon